jgi:hypothetical protein
LDSPEGSEHSQLLSSNKVHGDDQVGRSHTYLHKRSGGLDQVQSHLHTGLGTGRLDDEVDGVPSSGLDVELGHHGVGGSFGEVGSGFVGVRRGLRSWRTRKGLETSVSLVRLHLDYDLQVGRCR